jgi:C1A family cysteine protease
MKLATTLVAFVASASASGMEKDPMFPRFQKFMSQYNRRYATQSETQGRFNIFKDNLQLIKKRNAASKLATHGINQFADIHPNEFKSQYLGLRPLAKAQLDQVPTIVHNETAKAEAKAKAIDWVTEGATTQVKNQGQCGSCWSFSATEQLESQVFLSYGTLPFLSEQILVSCDTVDAGCNGGNPINAWGQLGGWNGDIKNSNYPYVSGTTQADGTCKFSSGTPPSTDIVKNTVPISYSLIASSASQESNMVAQIQKSPMSICVDAASLWQTYTGGIITASDGCGTSIDHAVQVVGYTPATQSTEAFWTVRNSWGTTWGENGYIRVQAGSNVCGITAQASIVNI